MDDAGADVDLGQAIAWEPLDELTEAFSGASLHRVTLGDGRRVVVKRLPAGEDWLSRATAGEQRFAAAVESRRAGQGDGDD